MSSQPPSLVAKVTASTSRASSASSLNSPNPGQNQAFLSSDSGQRRISSGSGISRSPAPRNQQSVKPKHKNGKKFRALDEDAEAEIFSMQNPHGRKGQTSITHLMNFSLPPRPNQYGQHHRHNYTGPGRESRPNAAWGLGSGYHAVDKAKYVHANYRFVVDPRGEYRAQAQDADVHLDWNNVLQIIASSRTQTASCPICLGEPTAPRMGKCGHIFCLPCLIRYMHSEDTHGHPPEKKARWKKCPICWDSIYVSETRPVRWYTGQEGKPPQKGGDVVLRLVQRRPEQTLAMPRESTEAILQGEDIPWFFAAEVMDYARIMKGSEDYMIQQYDEAMRSIDLLQREDELLFGDDAEWTSRAVRMLREAREKVRGLGNPPAQPTKPEHTPSHSAAQLDLRHEYAAGATRFTSELTTELRESSDSSATSGAPVVPRTLQELRHRRFDKPQPAEYLFYQALPHYYLSPLDIRILKSAFGRYSAFPSSILPRVERVSSGHVVDAELRKRVKYLGHLPYGCEVAFLECDWTDLVSAQVLEGFKPMLEQRRKRHDEKEAREEKERVRIEKAEEREMASIRRKRPSVTPDAFSSEDLPVLGPPLAGGSEAPSIAMSPSRSNSRPGFGSLALPSTSPTVHRTVWGTAAVAPRSPELHAQLPKENDVRHDIDDGWLTDWERNLFNQQELAVGIEGMSMDNKGPSVSGGKKNKKGKKITLMSTATARRGA